MEMHDMSYYPRDKSPFLSPGPDGANVGGTFRSTRRCLVCIPSEVHVLVLDPHDGVRLDRDSPCGLGGTRRFAAEAADLSSLDARASTSSCLRTLFGCALGPLDLRAGGRAVVAGLVSLGDLSAIKAAFHETTASARGEVAAIGGGGGGELRRWTKGGDKCSWKTALTCRVRTSVWEVGPGPAVSASSKDAHCLCGPCDKAESVSVARLDGREGWGARSSIAALTHSAPTGACACVDNPVSGGACTWAEFAAVELKDGALIFGAVAPGKGADVLAAVADSVRPPHLSAEEEAGRTILRMSGTNVCGMEETELVVTPESIALRTFTEGACTRAVTCGACAGEVTRAIFVEDVEVVDAEEPGACEERYGQSLCTGLWGRSGFERVGTVLQVVLLGLAVGLMASLVDSGLGLFEALTPAQVVCTTNEDPWDPYTVCTGPAYGQADTLKTLTWMAALLLGLLLSPTRFLLIPVILVRFLFRLVFLVARTLLCINCCCRRTTLRILGPASHELRVRPSADADISTKELASRLSSTIAHLKADRARARADAAMGTAKSSGGGREAPLQPASWGVTAAAAAAVTAAAAYAPPTGRGLAFTNRARGGAAAEPEEEALAPAPASGLSRAPMTFVKSRGGAGVQ
jgi:hypothetical protein